MSEIKNVSDTEAVNKIQEFVHHNATCLFCTSIREDAPFMTRPMAVQLVDNAGNLWFLSAKDSDKNLEIRQDDAVQLLFDSDGHSRFLSLFGHAEIEHDRRRIEELWQPLDKAWFAEGEEDASISVIRFVPHEGYYWDTKHGKLVTFLKLVGSMAGGHAADEGVQGRVSL